MDQFIANYRNGRIGISLADSTGRRVDYNTDSCFPLASTVKIPICVEAYRQIASNAADPCGTAHMTENKKSPGSGRLQYRDESDFELRELTYLMMQTSDNTATDMVLEVIGFENVRRLTEPYKMDVVMEMRPWFLALAGLASEFHGLKPEEIVRMWNGKSYKEKRASAKKILDENKATPLELLQRDYYSREECAALGIALESFARPGLFNKFIMDLYSGSFGFSTKENVMQTMCDADSFIKDALCSKPGLRTYTKPGEIAGATTDAGIILNESRPEWHMAASLFIADAEDTEQATRDMPKIAEICYDCMQKLP